MVKHDLFDNSQEAFIVFEANKQQLAFFPKEESQMFQSKNYNFISSDPDEQTENTDADAFAQRATGSYIPLNSSHTATDYIGAATMNVPYIIYDAFANIKVYDAQSNTYKDLYQVSDTLQKLGTIGSGVQTLRIPTDAFNFIIDEDDLTAIAANGGSRVKKLFGKYYVSIKPKYVESYISNVIAKSHVAWADMASNDNGSGEPNLKRRNIYECNKENFKNTDWQFEDDSKQSGRLYGSIVEVWTASGDRLKQVKVMTENIFNFDETTAMQFVLYPDNMGYDSSSQVIGIGDKIRVYPRETYFNDILIEVNYKDKYLQLENMIAFMMNDVARDLLTGSYQVYDDKGLKVEPNGTVTGNVLHKYQISQTDRFELRKVIKG